MKLVSLLSALASVLSPIIISGGMAFLIYFPQSDWAHRNLPSIAYTPSGWDGVGYAALLIWTILFSSGLGILLSMLSLTAAALAEKPTRWLLLFLGIVALMFNVALFAVIGRFAPAL